MRDSLPARSITSDSRPWRLASLRMASVWRAVLAVLLVAAPAVPAQARVLVVFRSFNGSWLWGHYPHTFIELTGTLDAGGRPVHENYGYTAVSATPDVLDGNVAGTIDSEPAKYLQSTNVHFTVPISDAQYAAIEAEVVKWRDAPGKAYNLNTHNCVNFVARIATMVGLRVDVPAKLEERPKAWLNYVATLNPQLHAAAVP